MILYSDNGKRLDILSPMGWGTRVFFGLISLIPLLAPYELILRVEWTTYWHPFFILAALISAGAVAVSGFLLYAAVAGLNTRMTFDKNISTFTYTQSAPVVRLQKRVYPLNAIDRIEVKMNDWSDGPPSYKLMVTMQDSTTFATGASWSLEKTEEEKSSVESFLSRTQPKF